ncbi:hypothetical protein G9A89_016800 [Geosiphon pyriformis]|nr:hypothetical protein G9A89_016800 [Geosiphon pyriformis]
MYELRELKKNLRQEKYKNENEKHWWIEDIKALEKQKEKLEKQKEKQKEKLEEEVKELKTSKDRWELQMQKLQNTLMETTQTGNSGVGKWNRIKKYFLWGNRVVCNRVE